MTFQRHDTALQNLVEAANQVLVRPVLVFPNYFDCHISLLYQTFSNLPTPIFGVVLAGSSGICSIM